MAAQTVSCKLSVSLPYRMLRGENEQFPRSFGLSAELRAQGLQRGYSPAQCDAIDRACQDYMEFAKKGELSYWSTDILKREAGNQVETDAEAAKREAEILAERRLAQLKMLKDLISKGALKM